MNAAQALKVVVAISVEEFNQNIEKCEIPIISTTVANHSSKLKTNLFDILLQIT